MTKDVIYIDVEDDITTIIGNIKASKEKIIALVPPSRVGVLQSAVSMRLLQRTAEQNGKRLVLISNNHALASLAAAAKIPVAKNLQSKPELAEVPVLKVDDDEVIDGEMLPVGELARAAEGKNKDAAVLEAIQAGAVDGEPAAATRPRAKAAKAAKSTKGSKKVPEFSSFRKKLFLIGGGVLALIIFMVWAIWFAPRATVVITAKTIPVTVGDNVTLSTSATTSAKNKVMKVIRQEEKKDLSVDFTPTGKKEVGDKATGQVRLSIRDIDLLGKTVPAGTELSSSSGVVFVTDSAATFTLENYRGVVVGITAAKIGSSYNGAVGSVDGAPSGVSARIVDATTGGSSKEVTVVSADDVSKATSKLEDEKDSSLRSKLESAFGESSIVIGDSYQEKRSKPSSSVAVGSEASGSVTLKSTLTASMVAVDKVDLSNYLKQAIEIEIDGKKDQKIYGDGADEAKFTQFNQDGDTSIVRLTANGTIGPEVDESEVKDQARGKNYGDIQSSIESIDGVEDVETKFWPFWVSTVPDDVNRIKVEFKLENVQ